MQGTCYPNRLQGWWDAGGGSQGTRRKGIPHHSSCLAMFSGILCSGTWPGPSFMTCTPLAQARRVSSPCVFSSANYRAHSDTQQRHQQWQHESITCMLLSDVAVADVS
jgi:hypothetical protein